MPAHPAQLVTVQQRVGRSWRVIGRPALSRTSRFVLRHRFRQFGVATLRVLFASDARNIGAASPQLDLSVGIHKIRHVVVIMQENRSFDSYFGTFPGAEGIPMRDGAPSVCVPDPKKGMCERPFPDHADVNGGGPHSLANAVADIDGGRMDGFVAQAQAGLLGCLDATNPACTNSEVPDVLGYHTGSDLPNYWSYAHDYVLQDHMFEPNASWSLPEHLFQVSEWSAYCTRHDDPTSCTKAIQGPNQDWLQNIMVSAISREASYSAEQQITSLLRDRHRIRSGQDDDFFVRNQADIAEMADQTSQVMTYLLASIASVSLIVGGIGSRSRPRGTGDRKRHFEREEK